MIQSKMQRERRVQENRAEHPRTAGWHRMFQHACNNPRRGWETRQQTETFKEVIAENFLKLMRNNKTQTQETQRTKTY